MAPEEVAHSHQHGYVVPAGFNLDASELEWIKARHAALVNQHAESSPEYADYIPHLLPLDPGFKTVVTRNPTILEMVRQVVGPDVCLWNQSFFAKPAGTGRKVPFHQDGEYWPIRPLATCTVWIAIDDSSVDNGCLKVVPGSHSSGRLFEHEFKDDPEHLALGLELKAGTYEPAAAVPIELEPGQVSLHDVYLAHGSERNASRRSRRGMTLRFMPTTSVYDRDAVKEDGGPTPGPVSMRSLPLYLAAGRDVSGKNDFVGRLSSDVSSSSSSSSSSSTGGGGTGTRETKREDASKDSSSSNGSGTSRL